MQKSLTTSELVGKAGLGRVESVHNWGRRWRDHGTSTTCTVSRAPRTTTSIPIRTTGSTSGPSTSVPTWASTSTPSFPIFFSAGFQPRITWMASSLILHNLQEKHAPISVVSPVQRISLDLPLGRAKVSSAILSGFSLSENSRSTKTQEKLYNNNNATPRPDLPGVWP